MNLRVGGRLIVLRFILVLIVFLAASPAASAQSVPSPAAQQASPRAPSRAPMPDWVRDIAIPSPSEALRSRPYQMLLVNNQARYASDHHDLFSRAAVLVQDPQALQALGNIALPWQADQSDLIIHHVRIRRGATEIDLLANGRDFTVLRRENNLESAMLDGVLTAVMQAEGLAVGDILDLAFTIRRRAGAIPLSADGVVALNADATVRRLYTRQIWPADMTVRWRGTGPLTRPTLRNGREGSELVLDLADATGIRPPDNAPPRFSLPAMLQVSAYRDWTQVSATFAPLYQRARTIAPGSPLQAEIARIAAASADPRVRTMAALRLVQDQVRYFALLMGEGNYRPSTAEETWARRYGDCKGKAALLLALLDGLAVQAEPVLVNVTTGDAIDALLPTPAAFNHIIVRATIEGQSYWLDGTRAGDRQLADLASSPFIWSLPVRAEGGALERLSSAPPLAPLLETETTYDGRQGFTEAVPVTMEVRYRGEMAVAMRAALSQIGREEFVRRMRDEIELPGEGGTIARLDVRDDPDGGPFSLVATGTTRMNWWPSPGGASRRFRFEDGTIEWQHDFARIAGADRTAPVALNWPVSLAQSETVILPDGGRGYTLDGRSFERVAAGTRIGRQLTLSGDRAVARSVFVRLEREISAAAARESIPALTEINGDEAYLRAPVGTQTAPRTPATPAVGSSAQTDALLRTGYDLMNTGRTRQALVEFDRAIALTPESARAHANRGVALTHLNRLAEAEQALAIAMRIDAGDFVVHQGLGLLNLRRNRDEEALAAFNRSIEIDPSNVFTLTRRLIVLVRLGRFDDALADIVRILALEPRHAAAITRRAIILAYLGRADEAIAAIDAAQAIEPRDLGIAMTRVGILERAGRTADAREANRRMLAIFESLLPADDDSSYNTGRIHFLVRAGRHRDALALADAHLRRYPGLVAVLADRCMVRFEANVEPERALRDCNEALQLEPGHPIALPARAMLHLRARRWAEARRDFDAILQAEGQRSDALYGPALARLGSGDAQGADRDAAQALRYDFTVELDYTRRGFAPIRPVATAATSS